MELKGKKVTVIGLGQSGVGAANLLSDMGAVVTVTDRKSEDELVDSIKRLVPSVQLALGGHPDDIFMSADMIVISPGVPIEIEPIAAARANGITVIGELELGYQIVTSNALRVTSKDNNSSLVTRHLSPAFLAITGTNGKSTTTALLDYMLRKGGFKTLLGGNIGNALTEEIYKIVTSNELRVTSKDNNSLLDFIVVEVSSFQLEAIDKFRPHIASLLNITPDHLDRYHSMAEYRNAKARIFEKQDKNDLLLLNADDPETVKVESEKLKVKSEGPRILYLSRQKEVEGVYCKDGKVYCNIPDLSFPTSHFPFINADEIRIKGVHNLENAMAASAMALLADCPLEAVIESLREFEGLEHRLELVRELDGVKYINDSKGTNVGAVVKSLESFQDPLILIAGGRDKAGDFSLLRNLVTEKVKALLLIGEAGEKIKDVLSDVTDTVMAKDLEEAVTVSHDMAEKGDIVLLSPACASFDMFQDFQDRGRQFKKIVMELNTLKIEGRRLRN